MKDGQYGVVMKMGEAVLKILNMTCPSLPYRRFTSMVKEARSIYRRSLCRLSPQCMEYDLLLEKGYLKEKHWNYAILMAAAESLPLLYQKCTLKEILWAVLGKASLGTSSKLLDNLNDDIHTTHEAHESLDNYLCALKTGIYKKESTHFVRKAENSACEIASWIYHLLDPDHPAFDLYREDCTKLVQGQIKSLQHKETGWPTLTEYINSIVEKSIGDVWIDIDLCQIHQLDDTLMHVKKSNEYIFKSSLVYDDVQDVYEDIETESVNSVLILAIEKGIISLKDLKTKNAHELVSLLQEAEVLKTVVYLGDALFLKGVEILTSTSSPYVDKKGLLRSFRLVRLFNLRKLLAMNKDLWTLNQVLASFSDFESLKNCIPPWIHQLIN